VPRRAGAFEALDLQLHAFNTVVARSRARPAGAIDREPERWRDAPLAGRAGA
jgi:hypothetical protein